jgi:hypothetical protein
MTSEGNSARQFTQLILAALRAPGTVDKNALLTAASAVLDTFKDGDDERAPFLRSLAYKAMGWAVFEYPECYDEFRLATRAFGMACSLITAEKAANKTLG